MRYFLINKPYDFLSQFTREAPHHRTLADLYDFPKRVYPVGRLDRDSEGLLILTDDKRLNDALLNPRHAHRRTYWVQCEGDISERALTELRAGVAFRAKGKEHRSRPASCRRLTAQEFGGLPPRTPPVRFRKSVPDTWIELTLAEGKNRQVRRMCAAVGFPVLRLVRVGIEQVSLADLENERVREVDEKWLLARLDLS